MDIFRQLDHKATITKAKKRLGKYRLLVNIAGNDYSLKSSSQYSQTPKGRNYSPISQHEEHLVRKLTAEKELEDILEAVENISNPLAKVAIKRKFLARYRDSDPAIYLDLAVGKTCYYELIKDGLIEFAELYHNGELLVFKD